MRIAFIGDIIGRPGRTIIKEYLPILKEEYSIDFVIANSENASHGYGLNEKNAKELFSYGIDAMTGGNHTWDKKEIIKFIDNFPILRPINYNASLPGKGYDLFDVAGEKLVVINALGQFAMPSVDNPFSMVQNLVNELHDQGLNNIFLDFHAETTAEKRAMFLMLKEKISAQVGTHTHISTDDLLIENDALYLTDIGLTGCRDNVIGMKSEVPIQRFLTGMGGHFDIPKSCKKLLQIVVMDIHGGKCIHGFKLKQFDDGRLLKTDAWIET
jgi:metallophosphoesterase (TIGR00282 family)